MKTITSTNGEKYNRLSRWIRIQTNYNPHKNNSLWDFVKDEYGNSPFDDEFNKDFLYLDYFRFQDSTYAIDQFILLNSFWINQDPIEYTEHGKKYYISCADLYGNMFDPLYLEIDESGEYVRVYQKA